MLQVQFEAPPFYCNQVGFEVRRASASQKGPEGRRPRPDSPRKLDSWFTMTEEHTSRLREWSRPVGFAWHRERFWDAASTVNPANTLETPASAAALWIATLKSLAVWLGDHPYNAAAPPVENRVVDDDATTAGQMQTSPEHLAHIRDARYDYA